MIFGEAQKSKGITGADLAFLMGGGGGGGKIKRHRIYVFESCIIQNNRQL